MLLATPDVIRTLKRKLYAKAKQETAYVMHSMVECTGATSSVARVKRKSASCACLGVKNIGKPCAGKLHARFDEGGQARACSLLYPRFLCILDSTIELVADIAGSGIEVVGAGGNERVAVIASLLIRSSS